LLLVCLSAVHAGDGRGMEDDSGYEARTVCCQFW